MEGYRIRRDRSALADGLIFGKKRRGVAPWKIIAWLMCMGFIGAVVWQFDRIQADVLASVGTPPTATPNASTYAQRGYASFLGGDLESAIDNYCRAAKGKSTAPYQSPRCELPPANSDAAKTVSLDIGYELVRALVYRSFDDRRLTTYTQDAENWGRLLADLHPKNSRSHGIFAYALTNNGKAELAVPEGLNAVSLNPNDGEAHAYLSLANYFSARYNNAVTYGEKAVLLAPESVDAHIAYAKALFLVGQWAQAESEYKKAIELNPRITFLYFELAAFYLFRSNSKNAPPDLQQSAVAMYDEVLRIDNKNVKAYTRKCTAYFNQGDVTKALENCRNATSLDPNFTEAWKWQGQVYYNKRGYENAIESFETCRKQEQSAVDAGTLAKEDAYPECWYLQGLAYFLLGKCNRAYPLFNEVLSFTGNEQAINLTRRGIAGCAAKDPNYIPPTPIPSPTPLPEPIR
jgi:tetratricopeptide (TPR) repeat protein